MLCHGAVMYFVYPPSTSMFTPLVPILDLHFVSRYIIFQTCIYILVVCCEGKHIPDFPDNDATQRDAIQQMLTSLMEMALFLVLG